MIKKMLTSMMSFVMFIWSNTSHAQSPNRTLQEPEVDKACPEIVFNKIDFWKTDKLILSELRGKWVILDFWSKDCSGCIASLPTISRDQIELKNQVQFIMVGPDDEAESRKLYTDYQRKLNLQMPSAFDAELFKRFNVGALPHCIIIDPQGVVKAIADYPKREKINDLILGKSVTFFKPGYADEKRDKERYAYDRKKHFLVEGNGGLETDFIFRSLLSKWTPLSPWEHAPTVSQVQQQIALATSTSAKFDNLGIDFKGLYQFAYFGSDVVLKVNSEGYDANWYQRPLFEIRDSSILSFDRGTGKNLFCYSLTVPSAKLSEALVRDMAQNDLKNYFGYKVDVEIRKMPYWKLVSNDTAKTRLKTKGGPTTDKSGISWASISLRNWTMTRFLGLIQLYSSIGNDGMPVVDETGISSNIDIDLDWAREFNAVKKALQANGLDLQKGEKEMKVFVVKDSYK